MQRRIHMARLGIALVAFANGTAALTLASIHAHAMPSGSPEVEMVVPAGLKSKVQRLPRVPRREPFEPGASAASMAADE